MKTVKGYAAPAASAPLEPTTIERRDVGAHDVRIEIEYAGICHSDIHTVRDEWGKKQYPLTPGHEILGTVAEVGAEVTRHRVGDVVGVGCMVNSCQECDTCKAGKENFCQRHETVWTYGSTDRDGTTTQGGYSQEVVVDEAFAVKIPEGLDHAAATPLPCAGITLFNPLRRWGAGEGKKVAIVGMGGLGHVGVKLAAAMGAEVTVLSHSLSKKDDGLRFGAKHYVATTDKEELQKLRGTFDLIINTISVPHDLNELLGLLDVEGTMVLVGLPPEGTPINAGNLITNDRALAGSNIGGIPQTQEMLDFCAEHGVTAEIELIDAAQINEAYDRVVDSDVRYRFVIDAATF